MSKKPKKTKIKIGKLERRGAHAGLLFVTPWIIGALAFLAYPLITSFWYALNNIRMTTVGMKFTFQGYGNFTEILMGDPDFVTQIIDYVVSTIISVPIVVVFALIIALMLNGKFKGRGFFRTIFFLPVIIASGPILGMLTEQGAGSISAIDVTAITTSISAVLPHSLAEPISDLFQNLVTILWYSGVPILLFISGLQKIDSAMYEAAKIDGGSKWECFWKITLPNIKPFILLNCVYTIVFISNNDQNSIIGLVKSSMFSGVQQKGYGYASAMAWLYSIVELLIVGIFAALFMAKKDVYEKQVKKAKKAMKKEKSHNKMVERRSARNAKKIEKSIGRNKFNTYKRTDNR